ncbi:LETM1-related biofilm-associated protein [Flavobacterium algicola]|uniref:LETM1-related biofilm-associated protein n=1 Tax=Flavobacterium algicola TaxID=556529 RepID=UPI001EFD4B74|nr:LETM1-related biofilm-associated protein [Flavobacterium algicola]MCG9791098.1 hypothetical protein [Flavobacterium algicola]
MINPSAPGWIDKYFIKQLPSKNVLNNDTDAFYLKVRETGFIYGHVVSFETETPIETRGLVQNEIPKVALLNILHATYQLHHLENNPQHFIKQALQFYDSMSPQGFNLLKKVLPNSPDAINLEKIIDSRVQTNIDMVSKNFSHIVTNALLFIDVLAFHQYLIHGVLPEKYLKKIEEAVISVVSLSLKTKTNQSKYDDLLIKLFEASVRYSKFSNINVQNIESLDLSYFSSKLEKHYLLDMAGMSLWNDGKVENDEAYFLYKLADKLNIDEDFVTESIRSTDSFISRYKKDIPYFNYSNPVKHFYDQTTKNVETLIIRNKNRLFKEIMGSKELMILLAHSTKRDLDEKEKKKVKKQLLDICKTIPSLTIFLLPGGSLLLPILIKFIPKMLPSAFNENLDNE